jgi:hypothetical protein
MGDVLLLVLRRLRAPLITLLVVAGNIGALHGEQLPSLLTNPRQEHRQVAFGIQRSAGRGQACQQRSLSLQRCGVLEHRHHR